jgi:hypothetical protein
MKVRKVNASTDPVRILTSKMQGITKSGISTPFTSLRQRIPGYRKEIVTSFKISNNIYCAEVLVKENAD